MSFNLIKLLKESKDNERNPIEDELFDILLNKVVLLENRILELEENQIKSYQSLDKNLPKCFGSYSDFFCKERQCKVKNECASINMWNE